MASKHSAQANLQASKILAVSFTYSPSSLPRAVQVARLLKHLPNPAVLVCADYDEKDSRQDKTMVEAAEAFLEKAVRVPFSIPAWKNRVNGIAYRFNLPVWNKTPDQQRSWKSAVLKAIEAYVRDEHYSPDVLVTFGAPMSDHLIGLELKRRYGWPWIAHFSDPWADNPFHNYDPLTRAMNLSLERKVVNAADRLIFTSQETLDLVMRKYAGELRPKARVLPHAFDAGLYETSHAQQNSRLTIRHLGDLYGRRTPKPLFSALSRILSSNPSTLHDVSFELIGPTYDLALDKLGLGDLPEGLVVVKPPVKYLESLALMASADGLLIIDAPAEKSVFLPSKLVDYLGAGRPILGLTPPGAAATLINQLGGWVADPSDLSATAEVIGAFLSALRRSRADAADTWGTASIRQKYEAAQVAHEFGRILQELLAAS
ncbi:MAG: hypothetical protein QOH25_825 [Acidobacteriota bacterium]|jgi:glycosyltransferase involved in cell wall biosynthesis|nr:hypothetical protein [Acidobacteriota bacterium]